MRKPSTVENLAKKRTNGEVNETAKTQSHLLNGWLFSKRAIIIKKGVKNNAINHKAIKKH